MEDAVQEVLMECFRQGGVLESADSRFDGGFRAYLYGVTRNVTRAFEKKMQAGSPADAGSSFARNGARDPHDSPSRAFDRAWARSIMREAAIWQRKRANILGSGAQRRVELLHLRFEKRLPIREIAERWKEDPARLHHQYAKAGDEFREAVEDVVRSHGGSENLIRNELEILLDLLKA